MIVTNSWSCKHDSPSLASVQRVAAGGGRRMKRLFQKFGRGRRNLQIQ
jgi:hypothetical protein